MTDNTMVSSTTPAILIIDDLRPIRTVLRHILRDEGFAIYEAGDGRTALELVRGRSIDLLLVDAHMPDWDGVRTLQAFREEFPEAPTRYLVMTGDPTTLPPELDLDEPGCLAHGVLAKPFRPAALIDQVRRELRLGRRSPVHRMES